MKVAANLPFVVDTSVTMAWCFEDEVKKSTEQLLDRLNSDFAIVPQLWSYEVANVLVVAQRKNRITESQAVRFLELLRQLPIQIDDTGEEINILFGRAHQHGLSAYDAAYLCLSERLGIPLSTLDDNLSKAASSAGVELLTEPC